MNKPAKIVVALVIIVTSGFFIFSKISGWHKRKLENAVKQEQQVWQVQTNKLEEKVSELSQELIEVKGQKVPQEKLAAIFGKPEEQKEAPRLAESTNKSPQLAATNTPPRMATTASAPQRPATAAKAAPQRTMATNEAPRQAETTPKVPPLAVVSKKVPRLADEAKIPSQQQSRFADIERQIAAFFAYLDDQPYVQSMNLAGGSYLQYRTAVEKLSAKTPVIVGEMNSLYTMVRNVAHFYRIMGKKRVLLTRLVMQNEAEVMETLMKTFYLWFTLDDGGQPTLGGRPSIEAMYEYAGYILNTLGGRSYLLRRSPKIRALTTYYCVLILDRANKEELNSNGIDIRPYIKSSMLEIKNQIGLIHQDEYISRLSQLSLEYT